jgi:hypothetical protein
VRQSTPADASIAPPASASNDVANAAQPANVANARNKGGSCAFAEEATIFAEPGAHAAHLRMPDTVAVRPPAGDAWAQECVDEPPESIQQCISEDDVM